MFFFSRSTTIDKNLSHFLFQAQATISDYLHQHEFTKQFVTDELVWYLVGTNWPSVKIHFSPFLLLYFTVLKGLNVLSLFTGCCYVGYAHFCFIHAPSWHILVCVFFSQSWVSFICFVMMALHEFDFICHLILVFLFACSTKKQKKTPRSSNTNHGHRRHKRRHADK